MTRPLVSICIPSRDSARWLPEALDSVSRQTLRDFEVIVADDASRDQTGAVVAAHRDPRLRYLRHPRPLGVAANRNACLAVAQGRYIAWLDADDRYHPDMLAVQSAALEARPQAVLAHGAFDVIDEGGRPLPGWPPPFPGDVVEPGPQAFRELVLRNYVTAPTVLVRRQAHDAAGPYRTALESSEDWEMWLRLALHGDFVYTARPVAQYRWHSESLSRKAEAGCAQLSRDLHAISGVFRRWRSRIPEPRRLESQARAALAARALRRATDFLTRGERRLVLDALLIAWRARPALGRKRDAWRLVSAALQGNEYAGHRASRALLGELVEQLDGSRMADGLRRTAKTDPAWEQTLRRIARTVREVVPASDPVAFVDKWDPTLLHLSRRRGWHYPDRRTMPDGYPPDSVAAIAHLEELRCRGARYLVLPCNSFWWLDHYAGLARHLELSGDRVWEDDTCVIYRLLWEPQWLARSS
ncbi:MAG: glycosyltransferase family 2 protein [Thermoanaerobaculia bacterium]